MATRNRAPRREYITVREAAEIATVSTSTIRRYINDGVLPGYKTPGGRIRLDVRDVEDLVRREVRA